MDGSAIKGLELNEGGDACIRESSGMISRIYVQGYDTWLHPHDLVISMRKHFASCGDVIHVYIPGCFSTAPRELNRFALVYLRGEGAEEKALKLSGSNMIVVVRGEGAQENALILTRTNMIFAKGEGARTNMIVVKAYPFGANDLDSELAPMRDADNRHLYLMGVRGYESTLHVDYVKDLLMKHFSECGRIFHVSVGPRLAIVSPVGQDTVDKAL
ncbi:unnamed protein product [Thlaspi arvense]|uniref:RRM domain-containing protein n=1 Tax=Thlaspi arvense TaxID=13288 RepID=A0AAU9SRU2_THLAR|nr:unnamed protein product [Thlaspi arvense]